VSRSLQIIEHGLRATMASLGCASVRDLDRSYVDYPGSWR
jgi:isopentenyl diphosphate isomerase/L-lactate dehydrogenase-like FMN-dependent dehydrogenase